MSGRDRCYALPELQQWESAQTDHYVWGDPAAIEAYGKGLDTAGVDLTAVADSLAGMKVEDFWTGDAAVAFTSARDRLVPAVRGLATMQKDAAAALGTWQRHLGVYREDCASAISTGKQGWQLYQTTSCDNAEAQAKMTSGKTGISTATSSRDTSGHTCCTQLETAATKADVSTTPPQQQQGVPGQISTTPGQVGTAPSGQEPVPFTGPIPAGQPRPYVDPANGRIVVPRPGPWAIGRQPWDYADGSPAPSTSPFTTAFTPAGTGPPAGNTLGTTPSGAQPVPLVGPIPAGQDRPYVEPANGRTVVPVQGPYLPGQRPWVYADG